MGVFAILVEEFVNLVWRPSTSPYTWWFIFISFHILCTVLLNLICNAFGDSSTSMFRSLLAVIIGLACASCSVSLARIYAPPEMLAQYTPWFYIVAVLLGSLIISIPVVAFLHKMKYFSAALSWLLSFGVTTLTVITIGYCMELYSDSSANVSEKSKRNKALEEIVGE